MRNLRWYIYNPSSKPAHRKHVVALMAGLRTEGQQLAPFRSADIIYIQVSGLSVPFVMATGRLFRKKTVFYYHEPCTLREKLQKRDRLAYSLGVKLVQFFEFLLASTVLVSSSALKTKFLQVHPIVQRLFRKRIIVAPLSIINEFPNFHNFPELPRPAVLFLGRLLPDHRQFQLFSQLSGMLDGIDFFVLTRNPVPPVHGSRLKILHEGTMFSEEMRREWLQRVDVVWTPYDVVYNQTGVIPDALSAGCGVVISDLEPEDGLRNSSIVYVLPTSVPINLRELSTFITKMHSTRENRRMVARQYFSEMHGQIRQRRTIASIIQHITGNKEYIEV